MIASAHSFLVHFPIALLVLAWILETAGTFRERQDLTRTAWINQSAGTLGILLAIVSGLWTKSAVPPELVSGGTIDLHQQLAVASAGVFSALFYWRLSRRGTIPPTERRLFLFLFTAGVVLLVGTGYTGGEVLTSPAR